MKRNISHKDIFSSGVKFPNEFIRLVYSEHALDRARERLIGEFRTMKPNVIKLSKNNIQSGTVNSNNELEEVRVRLKYNDKENMYLILLIRNKYAIVKTIFLRDKKQKAVSMETESTEVKANSYKEQEVYSSENRRETTENNKETSIFHEYLEQAFSLFRNLRYSTWC